MPKRSSTRKDLNATAFAIVQQATGQVKPEKNLAAVALGRLGGLKGGENRAKLLTAARRKGIAMKAALARWSKPKQSVASSAS